MGKSTKNTGDPFAFKPEYNQLISKGSEQTPAQKPPTEDAFAFKPEYNTLVKKNDGELASQESESESLFPERIDKAAQNYGNRQLTGGDVDVLSKTDWGKSMNLNTMNGEQMDDFARAHNSQKVSDLVSRAKGIVDNYFPLSQDKAKNSAREQILTGMTSGNLDTVIKTRDGIVNKLELDKKNLLTENSAKEASKFGFFKPAYGDAIPTQNNDNLNKRLKEIDDQIDYVKGVFREFGVNALVQSRENASQIALETSPTRQKSLGSLAVTTIGDQIEKNFGLPNFNDNKDYEKDRAGLNAIIDNKKRRIADLTTIGYTQKNQQALDEANRERKNLNIYQKQYDDLLQRYPDVGTTQTARVIGDNIAQFNPRLNVITKQDVFDAADRIEKQAPGFKAKFGNFVDLVAESEGEGVTDVKSGLVPKGGFMGGLETGFKRMIYESGHQVAEHITHNDEKKEKFEKLLSQPKLAGTSYSGELPVKITYDKDGQAYKEMPNENYGKINWNTSTRFIGSAIPGLVDWIVKEEATAGVASGLLLERAAKIKDAVQYAKAAEQAAAISKDAGLLGASLGAGFDQNRHVADQLIEDNSSVGEAKKNALATLMSLTTYGAFKLAGYSPNEFVKNAFSKSISGDAFALLEKNGWKNVPTDELQSFMKESILPKLKTLAVETGKSVKGGATVGAATVLDQKMKDFITTVINPEKSQPIDAEEAGKSFVEQTLLMTLIGLPRAVRSGIHSPSTRDALYQVGTLAPQYIDRIRGKVDRGEYDSQTANQAISVVKTMAEEVAKVQSRTNDNGTPLTLQQKRDIAIENFRKRAAKQMKEKGEDISEEDVFNHANAAIDGISAQNKNLNLQDTHAFQTAVAENGKKPDSLQEIENNPDGKYKYEDNDGKEIEGTGLQLLTEIQKSKQYVAPEKTETAKANEADVQKTDTTFNESENAESADIVNTAIEKGVIKGVYADVAKENPAGFLKELADQAHGKTSDGEEAKGGDAEAAAREQYGDELVDQAVKLFPKNKKATVEAVDSEVIQKKMKPITDKMASIERELSNKGIEVDWDYDNETSVTDKKTGELMDPEDVPEELRPLIAQYEKATRELGDFHSESLRKSLEESRKVEDIEAEIIPNNKNLENEKSETGQRSPIQSSGEDSGEKRSDEPGSGSRRRGNEEVRKGEDAENGTRRKEEVKDKGTIVNNKIEGNEKNNEHEQARSDNSEQGIAIDKSGEGAEAGQENGQSISEKADVKSEGAEKSAPASEFTTKSGKQKVFRNEKSGLIEVRDSKTGEKVSKPTERKAKKEYIEAQDFSKGKRASGEGEFSTMEEAKRHAIKDTESPAELAAIYLDEEPTTVDLSPKEHMIADFGIKTTTESYDRFGDKNNRGINLAYSYLDNVKGQPLDEIAREMSDHYKVEITPQDLTDFMERFPGGESKALTLRETDTAIEAANKFQELTGLDLTRDLAKKIVEKDAESLTDEEIKLAEQDHENEQSLTDQYYKSLKQENEVRTEQTETKTPESGESKDNATDTIEPGEETGETADTENAVGEKSSITEKGANIAKFIRGLKSNRQGIAQSNIFGIAIPVYDGALEVVATAIEQGAKLADAIKRGIDYIRSNHGEEFDKEGFTEAINDAAEGAKPRIKIQVGEKKKFEENNKKSSYRPNWTWAEPKEKIVDPIGTYSMQSTGDAGKYLSGKTIELARGEGSNAPQEYADMMSLQLASNDADNMITQIKGSWGDDILVSGPKALDYSHDVLINSDELYKKIVLLNGLMREISDAKAASVRDAARTQKLNHLLRAVDFEYQRSIREASKALNAGRLQRLERTIRDKSAGVGPDDIILGVDKTKTRDELLSKIREGDVADNVAEKSKEKTHEQAQADIDAKSKSSEEAIKEETEKKSKQKPKDKTIFADRAEKIAKDRTGEKDKNKARSSFIKDLKDRFNNLNC